MHDINYFRRLIHMIGAIGRANPVRVVTRRLRRIKITDTIYSSDVREATMDREEKVRMWPRVHDGRTQSRDSTQVDARRRTSSSAGPSSANGITLTQWHSDYIIAGLSSGCPLSFVLERPGPITSHIRVRRPVSLLLAFPLSSFLRTCVPPRLVDYSRETNDAAAKE